MRFFYKYLAKNKEYKTKDKIYYIDVKWRTENIFITFGNYDANIIKFILKEKINGKLKKIYYVNFEHSLTNKDINFDNCVKILIKEYNKYLEHNKKLKEEFKFI